VISYVFSNLLFVIIIVGGGVV